MPPNPPRSKSSKTTKPKRSLPSIEAGIDRLNNDGIGVGRHEGKELLVAGAFAGERVAVTIEHAGQRRLTGRLHKVLRPSPDRVSSPCRKAAACQGCPWVALAYPAQLRLKEERVRAALDAHPSLKSVRLLPILGAEHPLGYRTSAKLALSKERGRARIGLYRRGSHEVVDIGGCPLHHPLINTVIDVVRSEIERQDLRVYDPVKQRGLLRYLTVRVSPSLNKAMVTFVTTERNFREVTHLGKWLMRKVPEVVSVQQNINASAGNVIFGRETLKMLGTADLIDQVGELRLRLAPTSFLQVNNEQAARIYALVRQWAGLSRNETAVDLYCGIGGIALHLAKDAGSVMGIEVVEEAVRNARENARMNALPNTSFRAGDAAELMEELAGEIPPGGVAVVNPPRGGCERVVLEALTELKPRLLIYVSCDPETLARDLDILAGLGMSAEEAQPVDMFPQTPHVETVVRLVPKSQGKAKRTGKSL